MPSVSVTILNSTDAVVRTRLIMSPDESTLLTAKPMLPLVLPLPVFAEDFDGSSLSCPTRAQLALLADAVGLITSLAGTEVFELDRCNSLDRAEAKVRIRFERVDPPALARTAVLSTCRNAVECSPKRIVGADISIGAHAGVYDVAHELMHALGLNHTCTTLSLMAANFEDNELDECSEARASAGEPEGFRIVRVPSAADAVALRIISQLTQLAARFDSEVELVIADPT